MSYASKAMSKVLWAELFPAEFIARQQECPIVYVPLGLCEPHGQISAFGLDTFKTEYLCARVARQMGGIVAPSMGYHVHEAGPSAKFLEDNVGEHNPFMSSVPPYVFYHFFLYQLRSFYNAGFQSAVILSGHGGAHVQDLRQISRMFQEQTGMSIWYGTDFDLVEGTYTGDHAGKYEISMLMHIRPDLIDPSKKGLEELDGAGGRLAAAHDANEATREYGEQICHACELALSRIAVDLGQRSQAVTNRMPLPYEVVEDLWSQIVQSAEMGTEHWAALQPRAGQSPVSEQSRWKPYEHIRMRD
ncbi:MULTISPECIES: creatininase family protein [unclassified Paenibacillus]|uniref:creatininase family protein n=1 Tax=unclassified Paenibacillus TaxID=185978 RepID=UPI003634417B